MKFTEAISIVLNLARQNVMENIVDNEQTSQELVDEQNNAIEMLENLTNIHSNDELAQVVGDYFIELLHLKVKSNGRVDTNFGDKTPIGLARTIVSDLGSSIANFEE